VAWSRETGETLANAIGTIDGMAEGLSAIRQSLSPDTAGGGIGVDPCHVHDDILP
jgi:hypothetical protein